ncbi:MAG: GTP cyclohydrolase I FolE [Gemmatimonadales bacterium]|nr:MAG: GTP cyclohydrolase I FolE [Gemmatimonadales bacterium]
MTTVDESAGTNSDGEAVRSRQRVDSPDAGSRIDVEGLGGELADVPFSDLVAEMIRRLGDNPEREGLLKTPERVQKSLQFLTRGYALSAEETVGDALFAERHHNMVIVKDIEMYSLCEHHMLPFFGKVHIAYIPDGNIVGLSKVARLVEVFARRLQVQERLTEEIAQSLWEVIQPQGVGVVIEAHHLCMMMRGVEKQNSWTITSAMRGAFLEDARTRDEFLRLCMSDHRPLR